MGRRWFSAASFNGRSPTRCVKPRFSEAFRACAGSSTKRTRPAEKSSLWSSCVREWFAHARKPASSMRKLIRKRHWSRNGEMTSSLQKEKRAQLRLPKSEQWIFVSDKTVSHMPHKIVSDWAPVLVGKYPTYAPSCLPLHLRAFPIESPMRLSSQKAVEQYETRQFETKRQTTYHKISSRRRRKAEER